MNAYFRSRKGQVDGPFFEGPLISMWQAGQVVASDLLCLQGTEDWLAAPDVMAMAEQHAAEVETTPRPEPKKVAKRKKKGTGAIAHLVWIFLTIALLVWFWPVGLVMLVLLMVSMVMQSWVCTSCGNKIEKTSMQCPVCQATLTK